MSLSATAQYKEARDEQAGEFQEQAQRATKAGLLAAADLLRERWHETTAVFEDAIRAAAERR